MAHSYLISSFLAPGLNRRRDRWGGGLENRARLGRQVARAVRDEVGAEAAVTAKVSVGDGFRGGVTTDEGLDFARLLEADGHLDALQLSGGSSLMNPMYLFRGDVPLAEFAASMPPLVRFGMKTPMGRSFLKEYPFEEAFFWDRASHFRAELAMPLMLLGGINRADTMQHAMEAGFDFVAMGRALLREPDLVARLQSGAVDAGICIHCNQCMPTIYTGTRCPVERRLIAVHVVVGESVDVVTGGTSRGPPYPETETCSRLAPMSQVIPEKPLRVVVWSTGTIGRHAIAGIDAHPDLELVGVWVCNPDKAGMDVGELAELGRELGIKASADRDELIALAPDASCMRR